MEWSVGAEWSTGVEWSQIWSENVILLHNNFQHDIGRIVKDPNGNYLIMEITIKGKKITLVDIYGPNEDRPQFYSNIRQNLMNLIMIWQLYVVIGI